MVGLGTLINVACILVGGAFGLLFGRALKPRIQESLMTAIGVATVFIGVGGTLEKMLVLDGTVLSTQGGAMLVVTLALGSVLGELLDLDGKVERFGAWLQKKSHSTGDSGFVPSFVTASCTVCIGAMAVVGSIEDGIRGDYSILMLKGILDAILICILAASNGKGPIFSAIPVALFQGAVTLAAVFAGSFMTQRAIDNLSYVGSALIFCVGLNILRQKRIRVANLLPAIFLAAAWSFFSI